jgi:hypothetical protein
MRQSGLNRSKRQSIVTARRWHEQDLLPDRENLVDARWPEVAGDDVQFEVLGFAITAPKVLRAAHHPSRPRRDCIRSAVDTAERMA